jgi:uncharacterized protein YcgL (UPF0745 family)
MPSCLVYRSSKKQETYLFLPVGGVYDDLPDELRARFGEPMLIMKLDLQADSRLAQAEAPRVIEALETEGYFLQLPPDTPVEELLNRKFG